MVNNDVSFILSFVILMEKYGFSGSPLGVCPTEPSKLVFFFGCLVSNGRRALLRGIRLGGSATIFVLGFLFLQVRTILALVAYQCVATQDMCTHGDKSSLHAYYGCY